MQQSMTQMQNRAKPRGGISQRSPMILPPPFMLGPPPPFMMEFDPFHDDPFEEDLHDPFDVIREIESKKRQRGKGFFGGPPTIDVHPEPDFHPALPNEVGLN